MKKGFFAVVLSLIGFSVSAQQLANTDLYGTWLLEYVESENGMESPGLEYTLKIGQGLFSYNTDVNQCNGANLMIDGMMIEYDKSACTRVCCDGSRDPIGDRINYRGAYILQDDLLRITSQRTYVLRRIED